MSPLFKKLNFKEQKEVCLINPPDEFKEEIKAMKNETSFVVANCDPDRTEFVLAFVKTQKEIDSISSSVVKKLKGDCILWFAYPKKTSKKYSVEINRDNGWNALRNSGFDSVRAVSIDDDWSALRFRKVEFIKA